jgi:prophage tail gpP-like protein
MSGADLTLKAGPDAKSMREISGWTRVRVTRGIERLPSDFDLELTELTPEDAQLIIVNPGDHCQILLGGDLVITGYIDRVIPHIAPHQHSIRVTGRGKCQDLVDCAAIIDHSQVSSTTALPLAQTLANKYDITVTSTIQETLAIPQFNIMQGETSFEVIERAARYSALLAYDEPDGNLLLTRVSTDKAASGFTQGVNIEEANIEYSQDQRFSEYVGFMVSLDVLNDLASSGGSNQQLLVTDEGVKRLRRRVVIAEGPAGPITWQAMLALRTVWEKNRRAGRSEVVHITADNWRDSAGVLWTPNTLAPVNLPALKLPPDAMLLIGEVSYEFDDGGTHCRLTLYPPDAFSPQPFAPRGAPVDVQQNPGL